jgi:hypothetical protein
MLQFTAAAAAAAAACPKQHTGLMGQLQSQLNNQ